MNRVWRFAQRHPAYRMGRYELGLYRDLWRWIHGEQLIPVGAVALPHPPGRLQMMAMFTVVLVVEMVVLHLLLPPGALRIVALLLSIWAVVFIWGLTDGRFFSVPVGRYRVPGCWWLPVPVFYPRLRLSGLT